MPEINRIAIFAIISHETSNIIRKEQSYITQLTGNSLALNFPIHFTLKGRFRADIDLVISSLKAINLNDFDFRLATSISCPKYINNNLVWLESELHTEGFKSLFTLHQTLERTMANLVLFDEVIDNHKTSSFRPHITLGWGVNPSSWLKYKANRNFALDQVQISHIAIVQYSDNWPQEEVVNTKFSMPTT